MAKTNGPSTDPTGIPVESWRRAHADLARTPRVKGQIGKIQSGESALAAMYCQRERSEGCAAFNGIKCS